MTMKDVARHLLALCTLPLYSTFMVLDNAYDLDYRHKGDLCP